MLLCENERVEEDINTWKLSKFSFCHGTTLNFKLYETRLLVFFFFYRAIKFANYNWC